MKGVITRFRRRKLAEITSGQISSIDKISHIAFGDGAENDDGTIKSPSELQESLFHEVKRYLVSSVNIVNQTTARYMVEIPEADLEGVKINEMALVDESGNICAIKTFGNKVKDESVKFRFEFDDEY